MYALGIRLIAPWSPKAKLWLEGRKKFPEVGNGKPCIWMHCASLGEFEQGRPVLEALKKAYPSYPVMLSFFSPSGYEIRKSYSGADHVFYLPIDNPKNAQRLIQQLNPALVLWVKYEYWYFYLNALQQKNIPILLISGIFRPSQPFFKWYGTLWRKMLMQFQQLFVQNQTSKKLLQQIGLTDQVQVAGDTRFDRVIAIAEQQIVVPYIADFTLDHPVVVAGSTWEEDEVEWSHYVRMHPAIRFIFAPHEVSKERLTEMSKTFPGAMLYSTLKSAEGKVPQGCHVLLIDNIGMLSALYQYAHVTYIGGGFGSDGIHNTLEAAVYGKPVLFGPEYQKFAEATDMVSLGAAFPVEHALALEKTLTHLFEDVEACQEAASAAKKYVYAKRGATASILHYVTENRLLTN